MSAEPVHTGGCQCGAVRYRAKTTPQGAHLCHCRMCQKASGNYFMPLASVPESEFEVTRGTVSWFFSSDVVKRGFCSACGTPLFFKDIAGDSIAIMLGSLDDPKAIRPETQSDLYAAMPWFGDLPNLPSAGAADPTDNGGARYQAIRLSSHQHPDFDTAIWPAETAK